jgi:hypothetical protein
VFTVIAAGQVTTGAVISFTVTLKEQVLVLPDASVAINTIVVTPTGKEDPLAGPEVRAMVVPVQLSVNVGLA